MDATSEGASYQIEPSSPKGAESNERSRVIILIGGVGSGKKTIANRIAGEAIFECKNAVSSTTREPEVFYREVKSEGIGILTIDTEILQQVDISKILGDHMHEIETVNLILFVIPNGRYTDESHASVMRAVVKLLPNATHISALVFTHCELLSEEARKEIVGDFRFDQRSSRVASFVGKGIYTVGFCEKFPDKVKETIEKGMQDDEKSLRNLVEGSEEKIYIASLLREFTQHDSDSPPLTNGEKLGSDRSATKRQYGCSIV